ncbi:MAG: Wzz/FepE/Etk N-terminal domain-containing protein [Bacteroidota bacterium]|nr:Wzz/FepE/Etk N-terminal domain-containing protein [Bacteroidota bacterium]
MDENIVKEGNSDSTIVGSSLLDFLFIVAQARKFLFIFIACITGLAILLALFTPKQYKASASVLPAEQSDVLSSLSGITSLAKSFSPFKGLSSIAGTDEISKYVAILKSKSVQHKVIDNFNLRKVYDLENQPLWKVEKELSDNMEFKIEDEGNLVVNVYDENPKLASEIANYLVDLLNEVNTTLRVTNATATRKFVEKRYFQNLADITDLEIKMKQFQEKYGVIAVPEQVEATVKSISQLYVDLAREEVKLNVLRKTVGEDNPILKSKEIELQEVKANINKLSQGDEITANPKVLIPLNIAPDLIGKYWNIYKNLQIQYKIAEFITPVYEQSKIEEIRNTPSVLILDKAYPPERKAKPKISLYALIGFVVSFVLGLFIIFTAELLKKLQQINPQKYSYLLNAIKPVSKYFTKILPSHRSAG